MNAIIENTLHIISKITYSRQGYLLQLTDQGYTILHIWGGRKEDFTSLNDLLFNLFKAGGIDTEKVGELPSVIDFLKERFSASFFIKDVIFFSERNQFVYILLFSDYPDEFKEHSHSRLMPVISILSHHVKLWFEQKTEDISESSTGAYVAADQKRIFNEWEDKFNLLIKTSPDLIFIIDKDGKIILINEASRHYLDYSSDEMMGKYLLDYTSSEDSSIVNASVSKALRIRQTIKFKVNFLTKYGQAFPFEINCNALTSNGKVLGLLGIAKDLSEKQRYQNEVQELKPKLVEMDRLLKIERARTLPQKSVLEELNRFKYDFISSISHEFRTTLASIIGFSETIESNPELPVAMREEFNKVIMSEGKRLAKLINYLLETSSIDDRIIVINKTDFELVKLIKEVINANRDLASVKNIVINFEYPAEDVFIEADRDSLYQVINALLNNAIRFTDEFGRVKLIVNNFVREVEIIISDTGVGIPEADQPYIFQRFFRVSRRISDIPSVGVGLVFVKQIIDSHKGFITVQSEAGSGATFLVKLPKRSKIEKKEVNLE